MKKIISTKIITVAGMLASVGIMLGLFKIPINQLIEIRLGSLPVEMAGMLLGPFYAAIVGAITDVGGFLVYPTGPYFPGFTVSGVISGLIFGFMLYGKKPTLPRIFITQCINTLVVGILLNSYWLDTLYFKNGYLATILVRLPKELIMIPVLTGIYYLIVTAIGKQLAVELETW